MELPNGITGFYDASEIDGLPQVDYQIFIKEISLSLAQLGYKFLYEREADITPNFHLAVFDKSGDRLAVICNSIYPIVALVKEYQENSCELSYIEKKNVENNIKTNTSFEVISFNEVVKELKSSSLKNLNSAEMSQITYWEPKTIGEVIFNWWD